MYKCCWNLPPQGQSSRGQKIIVGSKKIRWGNVGQFGASEKQVGLGDAPTENFNAIMLHSLVLELHKGFFNGEGRLRLGVKLAWLLCPCTYACATNLQIATTLP